MQSKVFAQFPKSISCQEIQIKCFQESSGNYIINSKVEFQYIIKNSSSNPGCTNYNFPEIDFDRFTLVGKIFSTGGCHPPTISYEILQNDNHSYSMRIKVIQSGFCKINFEKSVWCLIPKIPSNVEFLFQINPK